MVAKSDKIYFTKKIKKTSTYEDMLIYYILNIINLPTCLVTFFDQLHGDGLRRIHDEGINAEVHLL